MLRSPCSLLEHVSRLEMSTKGAGSRFPVSSMMRTVPHRSTTKSRLLPSLACVMKTGLENPALNDTTLIWGQVKPGNGVLVAVGVFDGVGVRDGVGVLEGVGVKVLVGLGVMVGVLVAGGGRVGGRMTAALDEVGEEVARVEVGRSGV